MMAHILWKDTPDCHDGSFVRSCFCATLLILFPLQYPIQGEISTRDFWQLKSSQKLSNKRAYRIDSLEFQRARLLGSLCSRVPPPKLAI